METIAERKKKLAERKNKLIDKILEEAEKYKGDRLFRYFILTAEHLKDKNCHGNMKITWGLQDIGNKELLSEWVSLENELRLLSWDEYSDRNNRRAEENANK